MSVAVCLLLEHRVTRGTRERSLVGMHATVDTQVALVTSNVAAVRALVLLENQTTWLPRFAGHLFTTGRETKTGLLRETASE